MYDFEEPVLFERQNVKVTSQHLVIVNQVSYALSDFISAEAGHKTPRVADWMWFIILGGILVAVFDGIAVLLRIPSTGEEFDPRTQVLTPLPVEYGWQFLLVGFGFAAIGAVAMAVMNLIGGRCIVRVETTSNESKIIYESRNREDVEGIVNAINTAIAQKDEKTTAPIGA